MMFMQPNCKTVEGYFRANGKCFSFNGSLLFLLALIAVIAQQSAARPSQDGDLPHHFDVDNDFTDVDNLEIHHVKMVDGVPEEDHPIIIYKEDFVTEDYVPPKNETKSEKHKRRYKDIMHRRRHHRQNFTDLIMEEKSEKTLFDIIPEKPLIVPEDMEIHGKSHMKLVPLIKDFDEINETSNEKESTFKDELQKRPKKFHRRARRSTNGELLIQKRNPYFRHVSKIVGEVPTQIQYVYVKHSVAGKKHNALDIPVPGPSSSPRPTSGPADNEPISFGNRIAADENDRVIFSGGKTTSSRPTETPESIFRDPRPENFDFSFMKQRPLSTRTPTLTRRPETRRQEQEESIFRDPRPENFDFSFMNPQSQESSPAIASTTRPQSNTEAGISQCVWAIVNCCSNRNSEIRYSCFEQNGCYGAFWGLNPCADNVRDSLVNYVADYYN